MFGSKGSQQDYWPQAKVTSTMVPLLDNERGSGADLPLRWTGQTTIALVKTM